jgi:peptide/nickel transport system substrate-binding protein
MNRDRNRIHPAALMYAEEARSGKLSRREFMTRATALGVTIIAAYDLLGLTTPVLAATAAQGGTLRIQQSLLAMKDPRTFDWSQLGNVARCWLEYLVEINADGTVRGMLLERWEANDDATQYMLHVRPGVTWNNGEAFNADHVVWILNYWCEKDVEGNTMAGRLSSLIDPEKGIVRDGAVEKVDDMTVRLNLLAPDITIIVGMGDYPAAVVHPSHDPINMIEQSLGTGPYKCISYEVGVRAILERNVGHNWWGHSVEEIGGAFLDRIEFIDYGTDPASWIAAIELGEIEMLYENVGEFLEIASAAGWEQSEVNTGATLVFRFNIEAQVDGKAPFADIRVRQALSQAVSNSIVLELGANGLGSVADNHHVGPIHPEFADIDRPVYDPLTSKALLNQAGMGDYEFELTTLDDGFNRNCGDTVVAMIRDAGIKIKLTLLPEVKFRNSWGNAPFSATEWNHRPLGVQCLALAYRTGEPWNETNYSNPEFDRLLAKAMGILDVDARRKVMYELETLFRNDAVIIQPFWRKLYRHFRSDVVGAAMHPSFEIHPYKLGFAVK